MTYRSTHWRDWIRERFGDESKYVVAVDEQNVEYTIRSSDPRKTTRIIFHFMRPDDDDVLYDIHFSGGDPPKYNVWMSPFTVDPTYRPNLIDRVRSGGSLATSLIFSEGFVERLEKEWLHIPIERGWTEEVRYIGGKIYRAKLRVKGNRSVNWDISTGNPFDLTALDHLRTMLRIGVSKEFFDIEPMT